MDCDNCVCTLCCRYAQDKEHREKIRAGEISCCDYHPRPDHALEKAIKAVSELRSAPSLSKSSEKDILAEACDVLTTTFVMLTQYGVSRDYVKAQILYKCNRALERYRKTGEV